MTEKTRPPTSGVSFVPHDVTTFAVTRGLIIDADGDVAVLFAEDSVSVILPGLKAGVEYSFALVQVLDTGTTATRVVLLR